MSATAQGTSRARSAKSGKLALLSRAKSRFGQVGITKSGTQSRRESALLSRRASGKLAFFCSTTLFLVLYPVRRCCLSRGIDLLLRDFHLS
jgi:hypothetical protein